MRLVFLQETFWPSIGGIEVLSQRALTALSERGYEPTVITSFAGDDLPDRDEVDGISVYRLPFRRALMARDLEAIIRCRSEFARLKRELRPDVMQINFSGPSGYFHLATACAEDPPLVMAVRHPLGEPAADDTLVARMLRAASWVTGNSLSTLSAARRIVPGIEAQSSVIFNGLRTPTEQPAKLSFDPPELLCLGRLVYEKGFHVAVDAFSVIHQRFPESRLTIAGDGPARGDLERQVRDLRLESAVHFTGWVRTEHVHATINRATLVLMPSREESFGLVALESGQLGRPVVASRVGGLAEVVRHGETGWTVDRDDPDGLATAALRLLSDPEEARRFGRAARRRAIESFSFERYVKEYDALYRRLVASAGLRKKAG